MGKEVGGNGLKETSTKFILCARNYAKNSAVLYLTGLSQYGNFVSLASYSADEKMYLIKYKTPRTLSLRRAGVRKHPAEPDSQEGPLCRLCTGCHSLGPPGSGPALRHPDCCDSSVILGTAQSLSSSPQFNSQLVQVLCVSLEPLLAVPRPSVLCHTCLALPVHHTSR